MSLRKTIFLVVPPAQLSTYEANFARSLNSEQEYFENLADRTRK
jgi:hypothetical protein